MEQGTCCHGTGRSWLDSAYLAIEETVAESQGNRSNSSKIRTMWELNMDSQVFTKLKTLNMSGCNSSLVAFTLMKPFFEILSGFGHKVEILIGREEFRDWISTVPSEFGFVRYCLDLGKQFELGSNASHNFLAIILAFEDPHYGVKCSVKNITSGFIWSDTLSKFADYESLIVIVPSSILSIRDGDKIELISDQKLICGIHLLYETEKRDNTKDERSNSLHSDLKSNRKWFSLGSSSTTVNVEEERSYPSKCLKLSEFDNN
ncbi:hypothetical protein POM88_019882 [Heracleum sosnowskyi]|uniref:Uncharacterized protein n=1 Tax=Heracleum sosnowskyi TaxID=360622 RepID=A0AAD8IAC7_9APIA|nr:hypothetical protein POM88_019882 [Heracleum sosnowskyi]